MHVEVSSMVPGTKLGAQVLGWLPGASKALPEFQQSGAPNACSLGFQEFHNNEKTIGIGVFSAVVGGWFSLPGLVISSGLFGQKQHKQLTG